MIDAKLHWPNGWKKGENEMDYLEEARHCIEQVQMAKGNEAEDQIDAQLATACALVAQTELLTAQTELLATQVGLLAALIEQLDVLTIPLVGGEKALQTYTYIRQD